MSKLLGYIHEMISQIFNVCSVIISNGVKVREHNN